MEYRVRKLTRLLGEARKELEILYRASSDSDEAEEVCQSPPKTVTTADQNTQTTPIGFLMTSDVLKRQACSGGEDENKGAIAKVTRKLPKPVAKNQDIKLDRKPLLIRRCAKLVPRSET